LLIEFDSISQKKKFLLHFTRKFAKPVFHEGRVFVISIDYMYIEHAGLNISSAWMNSVASTVFEPGIDLKSQKIEYFLLNAIFGRGPGSELGGFIKN